MKKTLIVVLLAALFASPALATESRVLGMGGVGLYIEDDSNVLVFPSLIGKWRSELVGEMSTTPNDNSDRSIGVNYYLEDYDVDLGLYLNLPADNYLQDNMMNNTLLDKKHMLMMGKDNWGLGIAFSGDSYADDQAPDGGVETEGKTLMEVLAGISMDMGGMPVDLGARVFLPSGKQEFAGETPERTEGGFGINLAARGWRGTGDTRVVPVVTFGMGSSSVEQDEVKTDYSMMGLGLGLGLNHWVDDRNLLVLAVEPIGISSMKMEADPGGGGDVTETIEKSTVLPAFYIGVESKITKWFTARVGAGQVFTKTSVKSETGSTTNIEQSMTNSDFGIGLGVGFHIGHFDIDGLFNDHYLYNGQNILSDVNNQLLTKVSVKYTFGKH